MTDKDNMLHDELEQLLQPRCEFHASAGLKKRVMRRAGKKTQPRTRRSMPWIGFAAAACIAAVLMYNMPAVDLSQNPSAVDTTATMLAKTDTAHAHTGAKTTSRLVTATKFDDRSASATTVTTTKTRDSHGTGSTVTKQTKRAEIAEIKILNKELPKVMASVQSCFDESIDEVNLQLDEAINPAAILIEATEINAFGNSICRAFTDIKNIEVTINL